MRCSAILVAVLWAMASAVEACSVSGDFVRSSTYEMVEGADAVVVATPIKEVGDEPGSTSVQFRVDFALKGKPPSEFIDDWAYIGRARQSDPNDISVAHPEGFMGPCSRMTFEEGRQYVVFLKRSVDGSGTGWRKVHHTFWRDGEDYHGPDSLWVEVLNFYIGVEAAEPDRMRVIEVLAGHLPRLERPGATPNERALAADIRDHLSSLSPWKPTAFLIEAYEALDRGESPRFGIRGLEANQEGGPAQALTDAVFDTQRPPFDREEQKFYILQSLITGEHPEAGPFFERIIAAKPTPRQTGMAIRWLAGNGKLARAYDMAEAAAVGLANLTRDEAALLISDILVAMSGDLDEEAWARDPYVASRWPTLALSLQVTGEELGLGDGGWSLTRPIRELFTGDWRADPRISLILAAGFDEDAEAWAIAELARALPLADWRDEADPVWLPAQMLVLGYGEPRDEALLDAYCSGGKTGRIVIMTALAQRGDTIMDFMLLERLIEDLPDTSGLDKVRDALTFRYAEMTKHEEPSMFGGRDSDELMNLIVLIDSMLGSTIPDHAPCAGG